MAKKKKNHKQVVKRVESTCKKFVERAREFLKEWAAYIHCKYIGELVYFYGSDEDEYDLNNIGRFSIRVHSDDDYDPYLSIFAPNNKVIHTAEKPSRVMLDSDLFDKFFYLNEILDFIVSGEFEKQLKTRLPDWDKAATLEEKMGKDIMQFRNERMERTIEDNLP